MKEFPKGGLIGKVMDAAKTVKQMHIPLHAAYAAYFIILAFFPALVLILSVLRYTGMEVRGLVELLGDILPSTMVGGRRGADLRARTAIPPARWWAFPP